MTISLLLYNIIDPIIGSGPATNMFKLEFAYFNCKDTAGFRANAKQTYLNHNEHVKHVVPPERLLRYEMGSGWKPLCAFLGKEVPDMPFPFTNEGKEFAVKQKKMINGELGRNLLKMAYAVVPVLAGVAALVVYRRFGF